MPAQVAQMVAFENAFFSAQSRDSHGDLLSSVASPGTAAAGPQYMAQLSIPLTPAILDGTAAPAVESPGSGVPAPGLTFFSNWSASKKALQASIYRGQQIFNGGVTFAITDVAGLDNIPFPPGAPARLWDQQAFLIKAPPAASAIVRLPGTTLSHTPSMTSPLAARHLFRAPSLRPRHRRISPFSSSRAMRRHRPRSPQPKERRFTPTILGWR